MLMFVQMMLDTSLNLQDRLLFSLVTKGAQAGTNLPPTRISVYFYVSKAFKGPSLTTVPLETQHVSEFW